MNMKLPKAFAGAIAVVALFGNGVLSPLQAAENIRVR